MARLQPDSNRLAGKRFAFIFVPLVLATTVISQPIHLRPPIVRPLRSILRAVTPPYWSIFLSKLASHQGLKVNIAVIACAAKLSKTKAALRMRFEGTDTYVATDDLTVAVNAAVTLERP